MNAMKRHVIRIVAMGFLASGCANEGSDADGAGGTTGDATGSAPGSGATDDLDTDASEGGDESGAPSPRGEGAADSPIGRRIRRMTADQYIRSLELVTGQTWSGYEEFAAAMGRPDYVELVDDDRTLSVTFQKFAFDAASATCRAAVAQDLAQGTSVILRHAGADDDASDSVRFNMSHLALRFLAVDADPNDPFLDPWVDLVLAPNETDDPIADVRAERWAAVCVGLATHPDFITY